MHSVFHKHGVHFFWYDAKGLVEFAESELRRVSLGGLNNRRFAQRKRETSRSFCGFCFLLLFMFLYRKTSQGSSTKRAAKIKRTSSRMSVCFWWARRDSNP